MSSQRRSSFRKTQPHPDLDYQSSQLFDSIHEVCEKRCTSVPLNFATNSLELLDNGIPARETIAKVAQLKQEVLSFDSRRDRVNELRQLQVVPMLSVEPCFVHRYLLHHRFCDKCLTGETFDERAKLKHRELLHHFLFTSTKSVRQKHREKSCDCRCPTANGRYGRPVEPTALRERNARNHYLSSDHLAISIWKKGDCAMEASHG